MDFDKEQLEKDWDSLLEISENMTDTTEAVNTLITDIENDLNDLKLGVSVWCDTQFTIVISGKEQQFKLGFCKYKYNWRMVCRQIETNGDSEYFVGRMYPIIESYRIMRLKACHHIPELIRDMKNKAKGFTSDINDSLQSLRESEMVKSLNAEKETQTVE